MKHKMQKNQYWMRETGQTINSMKPVDHLSHCKDVINL